MTDDVRTLDRLASVTRAARSLELEPLLQEVIAAASELTGSEVAAILEFDERGKSLRFLAVPPVYLDARRPAPIPLTGSVAGLAIQQCASIRLPDQKQGSSMLGHPSPSKTTEYWSSRNAAAWQDTANQQSWGTRNQPRRHADWQGVLEEKSPLLLSLGS